MDSLLALAFDPLVNSTAIRTQALKALGGLVLGHAANREELGSKLISRSDPTTFLYRDAGWGPKRGRRGGGGGEGGWGEEEDGEEEEEEGLLRGVGEEMEPALHCVLRVALRASTMRESSAADYVIRCFCEGNSEGQTMLASTITPLPQGVAGKGKRGGGAMGPDAADDAANLTFGGILVRALIAGQSEQALEASCRAASVLSHLLTGNSAAKERVLPGQSEQALEGSCRAASILSHLLTANSAAKERVLRPTDAATVVDIITQRIGLAAFFARIEDLKRDPYFLTGGAGSRPPKPLTRSTAAAVAAAGGTGGGTGGDGGAGGRGSSSGGKGSEITEEGGPGNSASASAAAGLATAASRVPPVSSASSLDFEPPIASFYDREFVRSVLVLEEAVRLRVVQLFSMPRGGGGEGEGGGGGAVDVNRKEGESEGEYAGRLRAMLQSQHQELQHLRSRNVALAKDAMQLAPQSPSSGAGASDQSHVATSADSAGSAPTHAEVEAARRQLAEAEASVATLRGEQETLMGELMQVRQVAAGKEADLQALSMAYHSLEQENLRLEGEVKTLQSTTETLRASLASAEAAAAAAGSGGATGAGAGSGMPEAEVEERVEAARQEAREEAQRESETELNDLLVCLGQEEKKVEVLRGRLVELGEDVDALMDGIVEGEEGGGEEEEG
ncbi:unnamed protein product [Closterium sp. Naga37s-1]|nr:unnamed protein product [Closterium sp. Naga37s-1]